MPDDMSSPLKQTALDAAHRALGARMVPFGGYAMPVQYEGVLAEHRWTREHAGLFDVSHMGPAWLILKDRTGDPEADHAAVSALIEPLIPGDIAGLGRGRLRYSMLLNDSGGIIDDLFVGRPGADPAQGRLLLIVNAGTKDGDFALIERAAGRKASLERLDAAHSLLALQGPEAVAVLSAIAPAVSDLAFMTAGLVTVGGEACLVTRSGYTGEDGFEILAPNGYASTLWERLLSDSRVKPIGLGARDSLRLEAGLPLYGHDLDETVSPFEAGMGFAVSKRRLEAGGIRGADRLAAEKAGELMRVRVGLRVLEGAPAREGAIITDAAGAEVGVVTSGGFSPTLSAPIALGFVPPALASIGQALKVVVRGKPQSAEVCPLPFVTHRYVRKS
jgi:aminomethyltransferase